MSNCNCVRGKNLRDVTYFLGDVFWGGNYVQDGFRGASEFWLRMRIVSLGSGICTNMYFGVISISLLGMINDWTHSFLFFCSK